MIIQELKQAIVDEVVAIAEGLRKRVYDNFQKRLQEYIDVNDGHMPDLAWKSCHLCNKLHT